MESTNVINLNGSRAIKSEGGCTIYVALPRELWVAMDAAGCCCTYCRLENGKAGPGYWDTLAAPVEGGHTRLIHAPELQAGRPLGAGR